MSSPVIFCAYANAHDDKERYLRNLPDEERQIFEVLDRAHKHGLCELVSRPSATLADILNIFQDSRYRDRIAVFHFAGHAHGFQLLLETPAGGSVSVDGRKLADFLGLQKGLMLVFLNGCATAPQVKALLAANVSAVIATAQAVDDGAATALATRFYKGLADGAGIEKAYREAAAAVSAIPGQQRWRDLEPIPAGEGADEPWVLHIRPGADRAGLWNLPEAAHDVLFGLPELPPGDLPKEPFRHLEWFGREHAHIFFGRGRAIRALYDRVTDAEGPPIILFYGQAGVGKSSVLAAGLQPRLDKAQFAYVRRNRDRGLAGSLRQVFDGESAPLLQLWRQREQAVGQPLIVVVDQVEEAYTQASGPVQDELASFFADIAALFGGPRKERPQGKLVLSFRKEWLPEIEQQLNERSLFLGKLFLERLDRDGVIEAITGIDRNKSLARHYQLRIASGLPEMIADHLLQDPGSPLAPTLQILLTKMWRASLNQADGGHYFDEKLYRDQQQAGIALGDFLDQEVAKLSKNHPSDVASGLALDLLAYHTTPLGTAEQRSAEDIKKEYGEGRLPLLQPLLRDFKQHYVLADPAPQAPAGATRLAHDTLAPIVRERFNKSQHPGQRARRILESRAVDWLGDKTGTSLDDPDLALVESGASGMRARTPEEERLVAVSRQQQQRRIQEQAARRRRQFLLGGGFIGFLLAAIIGTSWLWRGAERARLSADARRLAEQALIASNRSTADGIALGALLGVEALRRAPSLEGYQAVRRAVDLLRPQAAWAELDGEPRDLAFTPDGKMALVVGQSGKVRAIELATGRAVSYFGDKVTTVATTGELTATSAGAHDIELWSKLAGDAPQVVRRIHTAEAFTKLKLSPRGRWLFIGSPNGSAPTAVRLYDTTNGALVALPGAPNGPSYIRFSRDDEWAAYAIPKKGGDDDLMSQAGDPMGTLGTVRVADAAHEFKELVLPGLSAQDLRREWDQGAGSDGPPSSPPKGNGIRELGIPNLTRPLAFHARQAVLAAAVTVVQPGEDFPRYVYQLRLWKLDAARSEELVRETLDSPSETSSGLGFATAVALHPTLDLVAAATANQRVRIYNIENGVEAATLDWSGDPSACLSLAWAPELAWLATARTDGTLQVWDLLGTRTGYRRGREIARLPAGTAPVLQVEFSPDGRWLAAWTDKGLLVWDMMSRALAFNGDGASVAFSPDRTRFAIGSRLGRVHVYSLAAAAGAAAKPEVEINMRERTHLPIGVRSLAFTDDQHLAALDDEAVLTIYTLTSDPPTEVAFDMADQGTGKSAPISRPATKEEARAHFHKAGNLLAGALSPGGRYALIAERDKGRLRRWDVAARSWAGEVRLSEDRFAYRVAIDDTGDRVIAQTTRPSSAKPAGNAADAGQDAESEDAFGRKEDYLVDSFIVSKNEHHTIPGRLEAITADGTQLILWLEGKALHLYSSTGEALRSLSSDAATEASFSRNGRYVYTSGSRVPIIAWDSSTGLQVDQIETDGRGDSARTYASPDGRWLLVVTDDRLRVVPVTIDDVIRSACEVIGSRALDPKTEWLKYLPGEKSTPVCDARRLGLSPTKKP